MAKRKLRSRIYKKKRWMLHQSAVIPVYKDKIVIITTRGRGDWVIPKGVVEPNLTPRSSASAEAWEEAGITGKVRKKRVGSYNYKKWGRTCHVEVYSMKVDEIHKSWPEKKQRKRKLVTPEEAVRKVQPRDLAKLLRTHFKKELK